MKNEKYYKDEIESGSLIRYEINEDHFPIMNKISKVFKAYFNKSPFIFKYAKDIWYYKGGWPKPETPPRAKSMANKIFNAYLILSYIGKDNELNKYLEEFGLKLEIIDKSKFYQEFLLNDIDYRLDKKRNKIVQKLWKELFDEDVLDEPKDALEKLMTLACEKQKIICTLADEIKITKGDKIEKECEIKKGKYLKAVKLKYKVIKGKPIEKDMDKMVNDINEEEEGVINIFNSDN